ncbi:MAG: hypothetical protein J7L61_04370, partial [Thermoplasmata archaeon]|nr:hypothetical protein [Thermoplasmata archaeon]
IPHFTTLQKAAARLDSIAVRRIIGRFIRERDTEETLRIVSIDSTGYRMKHASRYYQTRLTYRGKKQDIRRKHLKSTISVDTKTLLIIAVKHRRGPASDHKVKTLSIIPARNEDVPVHRTKGKYRKEMKRGYNRKNYNRRVLVETENSVVKRRFSECIYSRKVRTQNRELELRYLAYNADRYVKLLLFISMRISTKPQRGHNGIRDTHTVEVNVHPQTEGSGDVG